MFTCNNTVEQNDEMNKLALLRNVYDDDHGFKITVTEQNGNIYSKYYRMIDYLKLQIL